MSSLVVEKLSDVMANAAITHPAAFLAGLILLPFIAATGIGATLMPWTLKSSFDNHIVTANKQLKTLRVGQCDSANASAIFSIEAQLRTIDQERWALQGLLESQQANARDRDRLGALNIERDSIAGRLTQARNLNCEAWAARISAENGL